MGQDTLTAKALKRMQVNYGILKQYQVIVIKTNSTYIQARVQTRL